MSTIDIGSLIGSQNYSGFVNSTDPFNLYNFNLNQTGSFQLNLSGLSANADVQLLNSNGITVASSTKSGNLSEAIFLDNLAPDSYTAKVFQVEGNTNYNLNLTFGTGSYNGDTNSQVDSLTGMPTESGNINSFPIAFTKKASTTTTSEPTGSSSTTSLFSVAAASTSPSFPFTSGVFTVGTTGLLNVDFLFDGGGYAGELAIFSLEGMESLVANQTAFIEEAALRAKSNSQLGHVIISDPDEGARFFGALPWEGNLNSGTYTGVKTFSMRPGDNFGLMLVPNGRVQEVFDNPAIGGDKRPLFSLATDDPTDIFNDGQIVDVTGDGIAFTWEDLRLDQFSDRDYNDFIFLMKGATGFELLLDNRINFFSDWRSSVVGQQILDRINTQLPPDSTAPVITANLFNDTGASSADGITFDSTIDVKVTDTSRITSFFAGLSRDSIYYNFLPNLSPDGSLTILPEDLSFIYDDLGSLPDGDHTLYLQATDWRGNVSSVTEVPFTLDTALPQLTLTTLIDSSPLMGGERLIGSVDGTGSAIASLSYRFNDLPAISVSLGEKGMFDQELDLTGLTNGTHVLTLTTTDTAGNVSTTSFNVTVNIDTISDIVLREGNSFKVTHSQSFSIPSSPSFLKFTIADIDFDTTDTDAINDALEVALVDSQGRSLVRTIGRRRDAFFNLTEGLEPALAKGVKFEGNQVSLDLSDIQPGTTATLLIRLVNNDGDVNTTARIRQVEIVSDAGSMPIAAVGLDEEVGSISTIDLSQYEDVSASMSAEYGRTTFNQDTEILSTVLAIKNAGTYRVRDEVLVGITNISEPTVRVRNPDWVSPDGIGFYKFDRLGEDGILGSNETTGGRTLEFYNPNGVQFDYELVVLSRLNQVPEFTSSPDEEALIGRAYVYDVDAKDKDNDRLTYSLLSAPSGMTIDAVTGKINWTPNASLLGNHAVRVKVSDGQGGEAFQQYSLSAIMPPPNRPPIFSSIPVVDASVNAPYLYQAVASDADSDNLTFSLVNAPTGMTVNAQTGVVSWTPGGNQVGMHLVKLLVDDGAGGSATQEFTVLAGQELGNNAPVIVSSPVTRFNLPNGRNPSIGNVNPNSIDLNLGVGEVATLPIGLTLPLNGTTNGTDTVFVVDLSGSMEEEIRWVGNLVQNLDTALSSRGISSNRYAIVGFDTDGQFVNLNRPGDDLIFTLYGPDNRQLESRTIRAELLPDPLFETTLPTDGNYSIMLSSIYATSPVSYGFQLTSNTNALVSSNNNLISPTTPTQTLSLNAPVTGAIASAGEQDIFTFNGTPGQVLYFDALEADYDGIYVSLVSPSGKYIFGNWSDYDRDFFTLTESGNYRLIFEGYGRTGDYNFQVFAPGQQQPLLMNSPVTDNLISGLERAVYRFDGTPGQRFYFESLANANGSWYLYGPTNQYISGSSLANDFEVTLPLAGSYNLMVLGDNFSPSPVNYSFKVIPSPTTIQTLNLNSPVTGEIALPGETDIFTFNGTPGTTLYYDALETDSDNLSVTLVSPSGNTHFGQNTNSDSNFLTLTEAGTYRLIIDGNWDNTGDYNFQLLETKQQPLSINTPITDSLTSGLERALYHFNGTPGQRLFFDSLANSNWGWYLYGLDNQYISGSWLGNDFETVLPHAGSYTLMVFGENNSTSAVNYSFKVVEQLPLSSSNQPPASAIPLNFSTPITGTITTGAEQDIFTFNGIAGQRIFFDDLEGFDSDYIYATLFNPSGSQVFRNYSYNDSYNFYTLTESGTYSLILDGNGYYTGDYNFQLLDAGANTLSFNTSIVDSLSSGFERALYHFDGTPGQRLYFDSLANANGQWKLFEPTNQEISGNSLNGDFEFTLAHAGRYTLMVLGDNSSNAPVNYNFKVNSSPTTIQPLSLNSPVIGEIGLPGEVDIFTFNGTPGTTLFYDGLEADFDNISVSLVSPSGNRLLSGNNTDHNSSLLTLTEAGTYRLIVDANGDTTGDYKFQLFATNTDTLLIPNQPINNQLASKYQTALYHFNGTAGQRVALTPILDNVFGTAASVAAVANSLIPFAQDEEGYAGIDTALSHNLFRPGAAVNLILLTDDQRQEIDTSLNSTNILNALNAKNARLNTVVFANFAAGASENALGIDAQRNAYFADGAGGFTLTNGGGSVKNAYGLTQTQYIDLARATGGAAWNISMLDNTVDGGRTAQSFSNALVSQLQQQIASQLALDVVSSDSTVGFQNLTGMLSGITGGQTATFNAKFTGNGETKVFDLLFKRPETNAILGSIPVTINANTTYFYPVQAIDADGDSLTYSLTTAPVSASIDPSTGRISWKPPAAGNYEFTIKVIDSKGGVATQTYSVNVTAGGNNTDPAIAPTTPPTAAVGQSYTYKVTATDADDDRLSYYLINPPEGASIDSETGVITWTPTQATTGQAFTVRVLDGRGGKATRDFTVAVSPDVPNDAPSIDSNPGTRATVSQLYRYDAVATDPNADNVRFDLVLKPEGMAVDAQRGTLVWQPTPEQVGDHTVVLRASDGRLGVDLQSFVVRVGLPNSAPAIASVPISSATVNRPYQYRVLATDADGDNLSYRLENPLPAMTIDGKGILKWTPTANNVGTQQVNIIVSDGNAETTQTFNLNVLASAPNSNPEITSTPRKVIGLGQNYFYQVTATDANSDPLTYSLVNAPTGMTIDENGRIFWQPKSNQFGNNNVLVRVADGVGGEAIQDFTINVRTSPTNNPPAIASTPSLIATVGKQYRYDLTGNDSENDVLLWSLDNAPAGMSIDPERGTILWTPSANQIGDHEVSVRLTDAFGAFVGQGFTLSVRGVNVAPTIISSPPTVAAINQVYKYAVLASDLEKDALNYSLVNPPQGMTINRETGLIEWTPAAAQLGSKDVEVLVEDSFGGKVAQKYTVVVSSTAANLPPAITSTPVFAATTNQLYRYNVTANDPEGENLQYGLIKSPTGMTINSTTGVLEWTPTSVGEFEVVVGATDASGKGGAQQFWVTVGANNAPVIISNPPGAIAVGKTYQYDVRAVDPNGDALSYTLNNAPQGMTIDEYGRITWSGANPGSYAAEVVVEDTRGAKAIQPLSLNVVADTTAPKVNLWSSRLGDVQRGDEVTFVVNATDDVGVESVSLLVNGTRVALDGQGRATVPMNSTGVVQAQAFATDVSGNTGNAASSIRVIDSSDIDAPIIDISSLEDGATITSPIAITGTVNDSNLLYYTLSVAPVAGGDFREIFRSNTPVINGAIATFDPSTLENDSYILRFEAHDNGGNVSAVEQTVNVAGELKLGNFRLSFTDLEIPVAGIPISVTRTYDTLTTNTRDDFGYGWRLEFRDTDLRTSLRPDAVNLELGIPTVGFENGTRVYITQPGGKREGFTFRPKPMTNVDGVNLGVFANYLYVPEFVPDKGVTSKLSVPEVTLMRNPATNQFHQANRPYNPADAFFGGKYQLTTKGGIVYEIDGTTGDLLTATDTNGNKLTYSDAGIFSDSGKQVTFERDAQGRIVSVLDPMGNKISYGYDALSNLVKVTDQEQRETKFVYDQQKAHYLKEIIDPLGRTGAKTDYDENGRLKQVINGANVPINIEYNPSESIQIVKDAYNNPTIYKYDERGNVLQVTNALGHSTFMQYDDNNNLTQVKDANNLITKYQYDNFGNLISRTEAYCGCPGVVPGTTYYNYNNYGQPTSIVLPTGASLHMQYDRFGNMLSMKDGKGSAIQSFTYSPKGLVLTETDTTGTTTYQYDAVGNVIKTIDADGGVTTMEYFADGKLKKMIEDNGTPLNLSDDEISTFTYDKIGRQKRADYGNGIWVEYGYGVESDWSTLTAPTIGTIERKFTTDGKLKGWVTPDGGTPTFFYDQVGRLWRETDAQGNVTTEYGYDAAGRLTSVKDVRTGATTLKRYDAGNRPIEEIDPLGGYTKYVYHPQNGKLVSMERGQYVINAQGVIVRDAAGNPLVDTTVLKQTWSYEYNDTTTTVTDPLGRKTTSVQDEYLLPTETIFQQRNGRDYRTSTKYLYGNNLQEAKDYPTEIIDIGGNDRDFTYDSDGRLWKATDLDNNTTTYTYGDNGLEQITGPTGETLKYRYEDALDNLTQVIYGNNTVKQMSYRPTDNRLGTTTLPSGETITYDYDAAGRIKSETTKSASGTITNTVSYTYDANSNVKTVTDNTGTTTYHYDPNTGANSGIDYPNGSSIAYTYDLLGRVKTIAEKASATATASVTTYNYDAFGNLKSVLDPAGGLTTMVYDVGNRLKERELPNGVKTIYEYDDLDRVKSITHKNAQGTVLASVTYERKGIGEPTKITREDGSYVLLEYDAALRVKKESYYNASNALQDETTYTYDAAGKRLVQSSTVSGERSFAYKPGYQLDSIGGAVSEDYDYDTNGRLTYIVRDGKTLDLDHDGSDRLTTVENETTGSTIRYTYDGQGRRVAATEVTAQRRFLVAPAMGSGLESTDLIADGNGNLISNYVYAGGTSPFMRLDASGNPIYYLTDAMGSTIGLADGTGASAAKFNYDSFGNLRSSSGAAASSGIAGGDFRFQGQWLEQGTGIYHFRARDYDAKTGTFLSRDPVDIIEMEPESFNPYQFVYNNPHVYSDPTGMFTLTELNTSDAIGNILRSMKSTGSTMAKEEIAAKANQIVADAFFDAIGHFLPLEGNASALTSLVSDGISLLGSEFGGTVFERFLKGLVCQAFPKAISDFIFFEPVVSPSTGRAADSGYQCPQTSFSGIPISGSSRPDFIISPVSPDRTRRSGPRSWLIGDIKLSLRTVGTDYLGWPQGHSPNNPGQWNAITNHARNYGSFITGFVTLFDGGNDRDQLQAKLQQESLEKGVVALVASILRNTRTPASDRL